VADSGPSAGGGHVLPGVRLGVEEPGVRLVVLASEAAAEQRSAISPGSQRFTRVTWSRTISISDSMRLDANPAAGCVTDVGKVVTMMNEHD